MKKKASIRAIDQGTKYDVSGRLRLLARQIERGEYGVTKNAIVILHSFSGFNGGVRINAYHFGTGDIPTAFYMLEAAKKVIA